MALFVVVHFITVEHDRSRDLAHVLVGEVCRIAIPFNLASENLKGHHVQVDIALRTEHD